MMFLSNTNPIDTCRQFFSSLPVVEKRKLTMEGNSFVAQLIQTVERDIQEKYDHFEQAIRENRDHIACTNALEVVQEKIKQSREMLLLRCTTNFMALDTTVKELIAQPLQVFENIQTQKMDVAQRQLKHAKKLRDSQFPLQLALTHPEFTQLLFSSRLAFRIGCFKTTVHHGAELHDVKLNQRGEPLIKIQGSWKPWSEISEMLSFDVTRDSFITKSNPAEGWNYISPDGLVPKERVDFTKLYPVMQLTDEEYEKVLEHAQSFYNEQNPNPEPSIRKEFVFQVVSTYSKDSWGVILPDTWATKNLHQFPVQHIGLRIITKEKQVYSFGYQIKPEEYCELISSVPFGLLATNRGKFATPDYQDIKQFMSKNVTSFPITGEQAQSAIDYVSMLNSMNSQGMRFNYLHQNCSKISADVMKQVGISVDSRIAISTFLGMVAPDIIDIPWIGKPLSALITMVSIAVNKVFMTIQPLLLAITPSILYVLIEHIRSIISKVCNAITTLIANLFIYTFGGNKTNSPLPEGTEDNLDNSAGPTLFSKLIRSFSDIFNEQSCVLHHPQTIVDWQKKQTSTQTFQYQGSPNLHVVPQS